MADLHATGKYQEVALLPVQLTNESGHDAAVLSQTTLRTDQHPASGSNPGTKDGCGLRFLDAPAIIIHSAISTPGDEERLIVGEQSSTIEDCSTILENKPSPHTYGNQNSVITLESITDDVNFIKNTDSNSTETNNIIDKLSYENENDLRKSDKLRYDMSSSFGKTSEKSGITNNIPENFESKKNHLRHLIKADERSTSLDEQWSESSVTDKLLDDGKVKSAPQTNKGKQLQAQNFGRVLHTGGLTPSTSKMSKSYNDLSGRQIIDTSLDGSARHHLLGHKIPYSTHNKSSSNLNKTGEQPRNHKQHLLPETRSFQGSHGMRSVSADDVRMRSGTDEYVWKDGKVQLKNGGVSHGESVRYVWKDGHVEKITSDANNEDTQVEILETSDDKTCNKINPVLICILLIAFVAVVIILPIYFTS